MKTKILLFLFLGIGIMTFQGCKKDDNNPIQIDSKGRCDVTSANIEVFQNSVSKQKSSQTIDKGALYFVFNDTKVEIYIDSKLEDDGTYIYDQATQKLTIKNGPNDTEVLQLSKVSASSFTVIEEESEVNGTITMKTVSEITFTKQ